MTSAVDAARAVDEAACPFSCDVTPGGAYFALKNDRTPPSDLDVYYVFGSSSLGYGYTDTYFLRSGDIKTNLFASASLVVMHGSHRGERKELHRVGEWVLVSPNHRITG